MQQCRVRPAECRRPRPEGIRSPLILQILAGEDDGNAGPPIAPHGRPETQSRHCLVKIDFSNVCGRGEVLALPRRIATQQVTAGLFASSATQLTARLPLMRRSERMRKSDRNSDSNSEALSTHRRRSVQVPKRHHQSLVPSPCLRRRQSWRICQNLMPGDSAVNRSLAEGFLGGREGRNGIDPAVWLSGCQH